MTKQTQALRRAELFKKSKAYSKSKSPSPILKQGTYFGWIQNVTKMFDFYFNWPQTAMPALIKVQPTGQSQQIFLNAKNIFKLGAIFRENAQRVQKI